MGFVNQTNAKNGEQGQQELFDIHDKRINELSDIVSLDGTALKIPEFSGEGPAPLITIDGVSYFNKIEIKDLDTSNRYYSLDLQPSETQPAYPYIQYQQVGGHNYSWVLISSPLNVGEHQISEVIAKMSGFSIIPDDADVVVFNQSDTTNYNKNTLNAEFFTAGYLVYDENDESNNVFYFNLVETSPTKVNAVKQGSDVIPLVDDRLPQAASTDEGKVVKVNASGEYELGQAGGGTQLYKHFVRKDGYSISYVSTSSVSKNTSNTIGYYTIDGGLQDSDSHYISWAMVVTFASPSPTMISISKYFYISSNTIGYGDTAYLSVDFSDATDTVTAL